MRRPALIVFQKNLQLGKVKSRLAATVGNEEALRIYKLLISHTYQAILPIEADKFIFYSDFIPESIKDDFTGFFPQVQSGMNLGERMKNAFELLFNQGYKRVLIIGTDCGTLKTYHINHALKKLDLSDVVIGPAMDGGYYLLGMKQLITNLFESIPWSTSKVFEESVSKLNQGGFRYDTIETLSDVDQEADWEKIKKSFE